jgi:uncharacterized protein Yka (UPF0111/DUF47 family)
MDIRVPSARVPAECDLRRSMSRGDQIHAPHPRNTQFYDMFSAAASNVLDAALLLKELLNAPPDQRPALARQLRELEHVGDQATHDIMGALNTSFITPFDREGIAVLAAGLVWPGRLAWRGY